AAVPVSLQRMRLQKPVADVDGVNVLLHDDVAGEHLVSQPVPKPRLHRAQAIERRHAGNAGVIVHLSEADGAQIAAMDALGGLLEYRLRAGLEIDPEAAPSLRAAAAVLDAETAGGIDGHGFGEVNVF